MSYHYIRSRLEELVAKAAAGEVIDSHSLGVDGHSYDEVFKAMLVMQIEQMARVSRTMEQIVENERRRCLGPGEALGHE